MCLGSWFVFLKLTFLNLKSKYFQWRKIIINQIFILQSIQSEEKKKLHIFILLHVQ